MKLLLFLFLSLFLAIENGSYSIKPFLDYLQKKGYWEVIYNIKKVFCDEVAIDICIKLTDSPSDCEEVVRDYMNTPPIRRCPAKPLAEMKKNLIPIKEPEIRRKLNETELKRTIKKCCPL